MVGKTGLWSIVASFKGAAMDRNAIFQSAGFVSCGRAGISTTIRQALRIAFGLSGWRKTTAA
ncbi:hypothetical protein AGR3A_Lc10016 [Agrobacterium tomkonis CFBP 6623]|uniref:Uncharacterized protein n=1 Tax=Agrobacterium tomkonis CFBP 6623 TaxID=1183432 RepID=A0A1S7QSQ5_9HYPH|nr:hypothetical protein AGR3A_Lc10016 [Agrobacterium tomkonis CFBP 6623]